MSQEKQQWRQKMKILRNEISLQKRKQDSQEIQKQLIAQKEYKNCEKLLLYISVGSEVETEFLFEQALSCGKKVFAPKVKESGKIEFYAVYSKSELVYGKFHIPEPIERENFIPEKQIDPILILVPGLAFDHRRYRLGYGGGYYDRYLQKIKQMKCPYLSFGLAFEEQIFAKIPSDTLDQILDGIVTPKQIYRKV